METDNTQTKTLPRDVTLVINELISQGWNVSYNDEKKHIDCIRGVMADLEVNRFKFRPNGTASPATKQHFQHLWLDLDPRKAAVANFKI